MNTEQKRDVGQQQIARYYAMEQRINDQQARYGNKRDYRKIDIMIKGQYVCSTTWAATCLEAKVRWCARNPGVSRDDVTTCFGPRE